MEMERDKFARRRSAKLSPVQRDYLANFMMANPDFAKGKFSGPERLTSLKIWQMFAQQANKLGPPKDIPHWQKAWTDTKCRVRAKVASINTARLRSGDLTSVPDLAPWEEKIQSLMGREAYQGVPGNDTIPKDHESVVFLLNDDTSQGTEKIMPDCTIEGVSEDEDHVSNVNVGASTSSGVPPEPVKGGKRRQMGGEYKGHKLKRSFRQELEETRKGLFKLQQRQNEISQTTAEALQEMSRMEEKRNTLLERLCKSVEVLVEVVKGMKE